LFKLTLADLRAATPLSEQEAQWTRDLIQRYSEILAFQGARKTAFEREVGMDGGVVAMFEAVTAPRGIDVSAVTAQGFQFKANKGLCDVWGPDKEGWRDLGIAVADFARPAMEAVAKRLDTEPRRVSLTSVPAPLAGPEPVWCENQRDPVAQELPMSQARFEPVKPRAP
jgi:hypothetical protein